MQSAMGKKNSVKRILKLIFSSFSIFFIGMLFFIVVYDALTDANSSFTAEYCPKYGFLASPAFVGEN
jgi:hypothetical protein